MAEHTGTKTAFEALSRRSPRLSRAEPTASRGEAEHLRPEFREQLASLESRGFLAMGVRAILEENGFGPDLPRMHCGCPTCAQRCAGCAKR